MNDNDNNLCLFTVVITHIHRLLNWSIHKPFSHSLCTIYKKYEPTENIYSCPLFILLVPMAPISAGKIKIVLAFALFLCFREVLFIEFDKLALLWGEAQKKIAYSYLKVT